MRAQRGNPVAATHPLSRHNRPALSLRALIVATNKTVIASAAWQSRCHNAGPCRKRLRSSDTRPSVMLRPSLFWRASRAVLSSVPEFKSRRCRPPFGPWLHDHRAATPSLDRARYGHYPAAGKVRRHAPCLFLVATRGGNNCRLAPRPTSGPVGNGSNVVS